MHEKYQVEVSGLHDFFVAWFSGSILKSEENFQRLRSVLAPGFEIIKPDGSRLDRKGLLDELWDFHGGYRNTGFNIEIRNIRQRPLGKGLSIVTYEERLTGKDDPDTRLSTAIFGDKEGTGNGVEWLHVHETWMPESNNNQFAGK